MRYYLDANNYDLNNTFLSTEAANFFFKVTSAASESKVSPIMNGIGSIIGNTGLYHEYRKIAYNAPDDIERAIKSKSNEIDGYVKQANNYIAKYAK